MDAAAWRCQCQGGCGASHWKTGGRCDRTHGSHRLLIAPEDATLSETQAAAVPTSDLKVWCPTCRQKTAAAQRRALAEKLAQAPAPPALFDL